MKIAETFAQMVHTLQYQDLSEEVIDRTKYLALDFIGLAARGSQFDSSKPIHDFIRNYGGQGNGVVIGAKDLSPLPQYAALANGSASHSLELDDVINEASLHPAVAVFPTAFALADAYDKSGEDLIVAAVIGYEVMGQLGRALNPSSVYARGFHPTGVVGAIAAAAAASKLLGLTYEQTVNALGIVGSQAAASMEFLNTGSWTKRLHPGWAAHNGMIAAELAKAGFTGPNSIIEGDKGFAKAYSGELNADTLNGAFSNEDNFILKTSIKPHACCRYKQGPLDLVLEIVKTHDLKPSDINKINVYIVQTGLPIVALPEEEKRNPQSSVDAQFSMHFGAAAAVIYRNTLLEQYDDSIVSLPEVKEMMNKVNCFRGEDLEKDFPKKWPARVEIQTTKGTFSNRIDYPKGDPENPLSWDEMITKFNYVTSTVFDQKQQQQLVKGVRTLEEFETVSELSVLLKGGVFA
ncbi:MmgE/PrpD family protein [Neobacillus niacini]|uniref:MmgE/PrpD family protein n=1 Tax=Neobacillus niacini TaxID=86668 RepID=UPI0007ABF6CD|nr:MmgE/PrpD family protein [Neobacillus niacini]MEC1525421.1 MmgE/PrpD family protein [Neobacillus niacini]